MIKFGCVCQWLDSHSDKVKVVGSSPTTSIKYAGIAQLVEQILHTDKATGSNPVTGTRGSAEKGYFHAKDGVGCSIHSSGIKKRSRLTQW